LRQTLRKIWPLKAKKNIIDLVVPPNQELCYQKLTVGKIYAGLLILENYRARKSGTEVGYLVIHLFSFKQFLLSFIILAIGLYEKASSCAIAHSTN
jgi:hypothetical protein